MFCGLRRASCYADQECNQLLVMLQVYELQGFRVTHAQKYPGPILSVDMAPDCGILAVGQADGLLCLRKHSSPKVLPVVEGEAGLHRSTTEGKRALHKLCCSCDMLTPLNGAGRRPAARTLLWRLSKRTDCLMQVGIPGSDLYGPST